jgi:cytochrome c5
MNRWGAPLVLGIGVAGAVWPSAAAAWGRDGDAALKLGEQVYRKVCYICHDKGVRISKSLGAPRIGDAEAWESRKLKGVDSLYEFVVNPPPGAFRMPVGALSEAEVRAAILYMLNQIPDD